RLDRHRATYRDSALSVAGGEPAALRVRPEREGGRLQGDRRSAGERLLSDRRAAARSVESVLARAREDCPVRQGIRCADAPGEAPNPVRRPAGAGREEYLEGYTSGGSAHAHTVACHPQRVTRRRERTIQGH